eukprot:84721_1
MGTKHSKQKKNATDKSKEEEKITISHPKYSIVAADETSTMLNLKTANDLPQFSRNESYIPIGPLLHQSSTNNNLYLIGIVEQIYIYKYNLINGDVTLINIPPSINKWKHIHDIIIDNNKSILFLFNNFHRLNISFLDLETNQWTVVENRQRSQSRWYMGDGSGRGYPKHIYLEQTCNISHPINKLVSLMRSRKKWYHFDYSNHGLYDFVEMEFDILGGVPEGASFVYDERKQRLIAFGGMRRDMHSYNGKFYSWDAVNDVWFCDLNKSEKCIQWKRSQLQSKCLVKTNDNSFIVMGLILISFERANEKDQSIWCLDLFENDITDEDIESKWYKSEIKLKFAPNYCKCVYGNDNYIYCITNDRYQTNAYHFKIPIKDVLNKELYEKK